MIIYHLQNTKTADVILFQQCDKRGLPDFVQVGGGDGLSQLSMVDSICGTNSEPGWFFFRFFLFKLSARVI